MLDIAILKDRMTMLVSMDNVHAPMSIKRPNAGTLLPMIRVFDVRMDKHGGDWQYEWSEQDPLLGDEGSVEPGSSVDLASKLERTLRSEEVRHEIEFGETVRPSALYSPLGDFLYGLENLRKKFHGEGDRQQTEDGGSAINAEEG